MYMYILTRVPLLPSFNVACCLSLTLCPKFLQNKVPTS